MGDCLRHPASLKEIRAGWWATSKANHKQVVTTYSGKESGFKGRLKSSATESMVTSAQRCFCLLPLCFSVNLLFNNLCFSQVHIIRSCRLCPCVPGRYSLLKITMPILVSKGQLFISIKHSELHYERNCGFLVFQSGFWSTWGMFRLLAQSLRHFCVVRKAAYLWHPQIYREWEQRCLWESVYPHRALLCPSSTCCRLW